MRPRRLSAERLERRDMLAADVTGDGSVDDLDFNLWRSQFGNVGPLGDADSDGTVTAADYVTIRNNLGDTVHIDDPQQAAEHKAALALLLPAEADLWAISSGPWNDQSTWNLGRIPAATDDVWIPGAYNVELDGQAAAAKIRVDGVLWFAPHLRNTLTVDTIITTSDSQFIIESEFEQRIIIRAGEVTDPRSLERGIIAHGEIYFVGQQVSPAVGMADAVIGDTEITLAAPPTNWKVGDLLLLSPMAHGQHEERVISAIDGETVSFILPLVWNHKALRHGPHEQPSGAANLTRSLTIESEATDPRQRGHFMAMHTNEIWIENASFIRMGRTIKAEVDTDPDGMGGGRENPRGRYAIHFHQGGGLKTDTPGIVRGSVVMDSPGWGIVNHSAHVLVEHNVTYDIAGAHLVGEIGDEIGTWRNNLMIHSDGTPGQLAAQRGNGSNAFQGVGGWINGNGGIKIIGNVSMGHSFADYAISSEASGGGRDRGFLAANLDDPTIWNGPYYWGEGRMPPHDVPLTFEGNVGTSGIGLIMWGAHNTAYQHAAKSQIRDSLFFGAVNTGYSFNIEFERVAVINLAGPTRNIYATTFGMSNTGFQEGFTHRDMYVAGWDVGVAAPQSGDNYIFGGYYDNVMAFQIKNTTRERRNLVFDGTAAFGPLTETRYAWLVENFSWDIRYLKAGLTSPAQSALLFEPNPIHVDDVVRIGDQYLNPAELGDDFDWSQHLGLAEDIRNRTTAELRDELGLWVFGRKLAADQHTEAGIIGVLSSSLPTFEG